MKNVLPIHLAIIGHPVKHSLSPLMHTTAARVAGFADNEFSYEKFDVPPEGLPAFMKNFRDGPLTGLNVTIPHKMEVMKFLDSIDSTAMAIGAVNTIVKDGADLIGYNTDSYGLIKSVKDIGGVHDLAGKKIFIYGAGGSARAVASGFAAENVASLIIANRTPARAVEILSRLASPSVTAKALGFDDRKTLVESIATADIIVNATSVGMAGGGDPSGLPPGVEALREGQIVVDIVYSPLTTAFLSSARAKGARTVDGLWMLIYQGAKAFGIWTGRPFPIGKAREVLLAKLGEG
jgi:shikimate dehydrogenase